MNGRSALHALAIPAWLGLVAGWVELTVVGWRKFVGHTFLGQSRETVWLTPLAYVLLAVAGVALARVAVRLSRRPWSECVGLAVVLTLMTGSLLSLAGGLSKWAVLLLALGIGVRGSYLLARSARFPRAVLATLLPLAAVPAIAGTAGAWLRLVDRRAAIAALPTPAPDAPNVLLIVWDVVRAASVSAPGNERQTTPNLERWAGGGVRFMRAQAPSSWTLPSHASMFTGREAFELSSDWNRPLDATFPTLAELFGRHGYLTGGFVGNVLNCGYEGGLQRGFQTYEDYRLSLEELARSLGLFRSVYTWDRFRRATGYWDHPGRKNAAQINARFLRWLDRRQSRPFFAFLNYYDAHDPYLPPAPYDTLFGPVLPRLDPGLSSNTTWTPEGIRAERDSYERAIAALDADFGRLLEQLGSRGVLRNTLVIVASDHGEEFGEHGQISHGRTLYLPSVGVPLVLGFPGRIPEGLTVEREVSLRDLAATIQSLTGLPGGALPGRSLERTWRTPADTLDSDDAVFGWVGRSGFGADWPSSHADLWAVTWKGWRYLRYGSLEELYFLPDDPAEANNLSRRTPAPDVLPLVRGLLDSARAIREGARRRGNPWPT